MNNVALSLARGRALIDLAKYENGRHAFAPNSFSIVFSGVCENNPSVAVPRVAVLFLRFFVYFFFKRSFACRQEMRGEQRAEGCSHAQTGKKRNKERKDQQAPEVTKCSRYREGVVRGEMNAADL